MPKSGGKSILGYCSLCPASLACSRAPEVVRQGLARHVIAAVRLARLAVNRPAQRLGLGGQLLLAAGRRCGLVATQVGGVLLLIDARNDRAAKWYSSYGAVLLADAPLSLVLPLATIQAALESAGKL